MAGPLTHYFKRSLSTTLILALVIAGLITVWRISDTRFYQVSEWTGWSLFGLVLLLVLYNVRKKISMLPVGRAWYWRRMHTWLGWLAIVVFVLHSGWQPPAGKLNFILWLFMLIIFASGIFGLLLSIALPPRITRSEGRVQLERIPRIRAGLLRKADHLIARLAKEQGSQPLTDFYTQQIRHYLFKPREFAAHCFNSANQARKLINSLDTLSRYIDKTADEKAEQLRQLIDYKHRLDRQYSLQFLLRVWTYVHVAFSISLLVLVVLHVIVNYAYHLELGF